MASVAVEMAGVRVRVVRWWAVAGILATLGGVGGVAFFDTERSLATQDVRLRLCVGFGMVGVAGLVVFAAGLRSYLEGQTPAGSLLGLIAQASGVLAAATLFLGYLFKAISAGYTHQITGNADLVVRNGLDELSTGAWTALALMMLALAVAALRYAAAPRWLGWVSAVVGTLVAAAAVGGVPAAGYIPGAAWLLLTSAAFLRSRTA